MGKLDGKVAFITGAARGQGRSHAVRLAEEGADIIAVDICEPLPTSPVPATTKEDLLETKRLVEETGRQIHTHRADTRNLLQLEDAVRQGLDRFGHIDIVLANAGMTGEFLPLSEIEPESWDTVVGINLTGAFHTLKATIPSLLARGPGGVIVLTSSCAGLRAYLNSAHYVAAKHGVVGLMRAAALELGPQGIRVNAVFPTTVNTPMLQNDHLKHVFAPDMPNLTEEQWVDQLKELNLLPVPWVEPRDISNAILFLCSEEARYLTGTMLPVDAGLMVK